MILLKHGHVVDPAQNWDGVADILIDGQVIQAIGPNLQAADAQVIDLAGKVVMPGFIDMHVHLREPGREDKETVLTGTQAAIHGGFTSIACMPNTTPVADNEAIVEAVLYKSGRCIPHCLHYQRAKGRRINRNAAASSGWRCCVQ